MNKAASRSGRQGIDFHLQRRIAGLRLYHSSFFSNQQARKYRPPMTSDPAQTSRSGQPSIEEVRPASGYAGDISPQLAWAWVQAGDAVLVDVRTDAEREWVGSVPGAVALAWKQWPGMALNTDFDEGVKAAVGSGKKALMLCRSGVRSIAAAKRSTALGLEAYNILEGFEGDPDEQGQRGRIGGWRYRGLPWRQS
jgi:rhodanese-related sulfurtransferase